MSQFNTKVEVVDLVDEGVPPVGGRRVARPARRLLEAELEAEADEADGEADHEAPEGAELVAPRPEYGEEEDGAGIFGRRNGVREADWIGTRRGGEGGKKEEKRGKW